MRHLLRTSELAPCDIVLYRGTGWLSDAIRFFDGGPVSHAGLYLERGDVVEALGQGLVRQPLPPSLSGSEWALVRRLKTRPRRMTPVRDRALDYLRAPNRYAYEQLVLLGLLCLTRKLPLSPTLHGFVRDVLDAGAARLAALAKRRSEPLICSEFVYRCYAESKPARGDSYTLEIDRPAASARYPNLQRRGDDAAPRGRGVHPESLLARAAAPATSRGTARRMHPESQASGPRDAELRRGFEAILAEVRAGHTARTARSSAALRGAMQRFAAALATARIAAHEPPPGPRRDDVVNARVAWSALLATAADFVTPGDLARSESLCDLGTLPGGKAARERRAVRAGATRRAIPHTTRSATANRAPRRTPRRGEKGSSMARRHDETGQTWTLPRVRATVFAIVARLTPGVDAGAIGLDTRFDADLGWDEWALLRLVRPVRDELHEALSAATVKELKTVGNLVKLVWESMASEVAP